LLILEKQRVVGKLLGRNPPERLRGAQFLTSPVP
jgi:hypothetical protein